MLLPDNKAMINLWVADPWREGSEEVGGLVTEVKDDTRTLRAVTVLVEQ